MKKFSSVTLGVALFSTLLLIGSLFTVEKLVSHAAVANWQQGASIMSKSEGDWRSENFKQSVRNLKATGANYVSLIVPYFQSDINTSDIMAGANTPSDATLVDAINYIHSQGMKVMLKPHLDTFTSQWRGFINPRDRATWYQKYDAMLTHLGDIGKQTNVESFCIGTELITMATYRSNPDNTQEWIKMINDVRAHYNGQLTYSANWGPANYPFNDEKNYLGFWPNLDFIGLSAYFELHTPTTNYEDLRNAWDTYRKEQIEPLWNKYHKQIVFTEIGYRSLSGARNQPWNYGGGGSYNPQEQANLYDGLFKFWDSYSYMSGIHLWNWDSNPNAGGSGNIDFTPQNKPAQSIMLKWFNGSGSTNPGTTTGTTTATTTTSGGGSGGTGTSTSTTTPPQNPGPWNATISAQQGKASQQHTFTLSITNTNKLENILIDVEITNPSGARIFQKVFSGQTISSNSTPLSISWIPSEQGTYVVKGGVFTSDWSKTLHWDNEFGKIQVSQGDQNNNQPSAKVSPTVQTLNAEVNGTSATINGTVNAHGNRGTVWFEYGTNPHAPTFFEAWPWKAGARGVSGTNTNTLTVELKNLSSGTYYYRIVAENYIDGSIAKSVGNVMSFTIK
jgi:hypothetical protein